MLTHLEILCSIAAKASCSSKGDVDMSVIDQPGFEVDDDSWNTFVYLSGGSEISYSADPSYSWYPDKMGRCEILQLEAGATGDRKSVV